MGKSPLVTAKRLCLKAGRTFQRRGSNLLAFITGALGIAANVFIYQQKSGKKLVIFKLISDCLWAFHYLLISANAAAAIAIVGIFRELVFINQDKKWGRSNWWLVFFLMCSIASTVFTWKGIAGILPGIASVLSVISFWRNKPSLSRGLAFPISASMLTYDIACGSYTGIINEIFTLTSALIGVIRYSKNKSADAEKITPSESDRREG